MPFLFEKLDCYNKALEFADQIESFLETDSLKISNTVRDQLSRASLSISLNLAEGNGRWHSADKRHFYFIARGSTFECVPILQLMKNRGAIENDQYTKFYAQTEALSKMITGLIKSTENNNNKRGAA